MKHFLSAAVFGLWAASAHGSDEAWRDYFLAPPHTPKAQGDFYLDLSQDMREKWESLPVALRTSPHASYIQTYISVLDEVALRRLVKAPVDDQRGVVDCAAAVACARFGIPEYMAKDFAYTRSRMGLRETLERLTLESCKNNGGMKSLKDLDEGALCTLIRNLFLVHAGEESGKELRDMVLSMYLLYGDYHKIANKFLWKAGKETLACVPLSLKLRAIDVCQRGLDLQDILERVTPMNERRALDILLFLRDYPRQNDLFWKQEPGLSDAYITWLASGRHGTGSAAYLLKCGELTEDMRQELMALPTTSQRKGRVEEWLREKRPA